MSELEEYSKGDEIINKFLKLFTSYSIRNLAYGKLMFHAIMGQICKHINITIKKQKRDLRIHPWFVQDSGSGKSSGLPFINDVIKALKIQFKIHSGDINEASLVGSFDKRSQSVSSRGTTVTEDEVVEIPGLLRTFEDGGILFFEEAEFILEASKRDYNKLLLGYLQASMNPIGDPSHCVERSLKYGTILLHPKCTFIFTSPLVNTKLSDVMRMGFFQRTLPYFKKLKNEDWNAIAKGVIKNIGAERTKQFTDEVQMFSDIIVYLSQVKKRVQSIDRVFFSMGAKKQLAEYYKKYCKEISNLKGQLKDTMDTFKIRSLVNVAIIASHKALLDMRNNVVAEDVFYASDFVLECMKSLMTFMETSVEMVSQDIYEVRWNKVRRNWFDIFSKVKKGLEKNSLNRKAFIEYLQKYLGLSDSSAYRYVDTWIKRGYLVRIGEDVALKVVQ